MVQRPSVLPQVPGNGEESADAGRDALIGGGRGKAGPDPALRLVQIQSGYFSEIIEGGPDPDGDAAGRVALIQLEVEIDGHLLQTHLSPQTCSLETPAPQQLRPSACCRRQHVL